MLTQLLLLLGLCYQVDVGPSATTSLICKAGEHTLQIIFSPDGQNEAYIDGNAIMLPSERRPNRPDAENGGWCE
jgi:hypothetical protein